MQGALDLGQSLVVDADIGVGASTRNAFLASFETVKKTLQPTPLCLLVAGVPTNRSGGGSDPLLVRVHHVLFCLLTNTFVLFK